MAEPAAESVGEPATAPTSESAMAHGRIVVGVDGSDPSLHALRWADRQAQLTGATVEAVTAWEMPASFGWAGAVPGLPEDLDIGAIATENLMEAINQALPKERADAVNPVTVMGNPTQVILDRAEGAELVVVGARGLGTFRATLLGSVSHTVTLHAPCPVVVVRGEAEPAD
jgi:nucleotide-binding universal stress UspA family protein